MKTEYTVHVILLSRVEKSSATRGNSRRELGCETSFMPHTVIVCVLQNVCKKCRWISILAQFQVKKKKSR